jgi:ribonucleotide reductase alpha subunit
MFNMIIQAEGSIQNIMSIPENIRYRYKTAREIDQRILLKHTSVRTPFVSQSQSHNTYEEDVTLENFLTNQMYAWKLGCTTGAYYTHTKPASGAIQSAPKSKEKLSTDIIVEPDQVVDLGADTMINTSDTQMCWRPSDFELSEDEMSICTSCST